MAGGKLVQHRVQDLTQTINGWVAHGLPGRLGLKIAPMDFIHGIPQINQGRQRGFEDEKVH